MEATVLNPTQLHLLKMFSFAKTEEDLMEMKKALSVYFAKRVEDETDALWEQGVWNDEKNEAVQRFLREYYK